MSVAFRRESDEEHLEPKFELPIPPGPNLVTPCGLRLIEEKVAEYEAIDAPSDDQKRTMRYWRKRLATAQLAPAPPTDEVGFGSRVRFTLNGKQRDVQIVGEDEADPAAGLIGLQAPLAQALIGAGEGELLPFGGKDDAIEIVSVGR
ncbi:MAG TPA: GreA/GreB family elongation factor [Sphingomonas sp.]|nr:GreA/GreB family elongation factor [Sphingomonas sp.]